MRNLLTFLLFFILPNFNFCQQVSQQDSIYRAIAYWAKADTMVYDVEYKKYKVVDGDTTYQLYTTYSMEITILDSTENSYLIRTKYQMDSVYTPNQVVSNIMKTLGNISVDIEATQNGSINGVKNWQEVSEYLKQAIDKLQSKLENRTEIVDKILAEYKRSYDNKSSIDNSAILDIQQKFSFHGVEYQLGKVFESNGTTASPYSDKEIPAYWEFKYDTLYVDDGVVRLTMYEELDSKQLAMDLEDFMTKTLKIENKEKEKLIVTNYTYITTFVDTYSGWVINSFRDNVTSVNDHKVIEERSIRLK